MDGIQQVGAVMPIPQQTIYLGVQRIGHVADVGSGVRHQGIHRSGRAKALVRMSGARWKTPLRMLVASAFVLRDGLAHFLVRWLFF